MLQQHAALLSTSDDENNSIQQPLGYAPMVIYCSEQEEVGCKGRGHLGGSHAVSVHGVVTPICAILTDASGGHNL